MSDFNENAKDIKDKANVLYHTAKEKASKAYQETKPRADDLAAQIGNTASDLYDSGKENVYSAEDYIEESLASFAQSIQKQPLASVLIAAGIGYLYAKFTK